MNYNMRIFSALFISLCAYTFCMRSLKFVAPYMVGEDLLTKEDVGTLASVFNTCYAMSKLFSGMATDKYRPKWINVCGLVLVICCICAMTSVRARAVLFMTIIWGLHGWAQGFCWSPIAVFLKRWYAPSVRGRWWSMVSTGKTIGGALCAAIMGTLSMNYGWRFAFLSMACGSFLAAMYVTWALIEWPQNVALQSHDGMSPPSSSKELKVSSKAHKKVTHSTMKEDITAWQRLRDFVFGDLTIMQLSVAGACVYFINEGFTSWLSIALSEHHGMSSSKAAMYASELIFFFESGGTVGSMSSAFVSDMVFGGDRIPLIATSLVLIAILVAFTASLLTTASGVVASTLCFCIGMLLYIPSTLIGMACVELGDSRASGTISGFAGMAAYAGAAMAGYPLATLINSSGWSVGFYGCVVGVALFGSVLVLPLTMQKRAKMKGD